MPEEIDVARAQRAKEQAEKTLAATNYEDEERQAAEEALRRAAAQASGCQQGSKKIEKKQKVKEDAMAETAKQEPVITMWSKEFTYDRWMKSKGIPIHRGYFIEDLRTIELEWWEERGCKSAFIQLLGQEGVSAARVTEIPPGKSLPPVKFALDEIVYVLAGRGLDDRVGQ